MGGAAKSHNGSYVKARDSVRELWVLGIKTRLDGKGLYSLNRFIYATVYFYVHFIAEVIVGIMESVQGPRIRR